ncbi:MAG TPA: hypothetical protein VK941_06775 [Gillisia sp.]|nr:hypothetical protein [Gillisia sp.]
MKKTYVLKKGQLIVPVFFVMVLFSSCASIPREAPLLSRELGMQIQDLENSHLNLVKVYFNKERGQVKKFIDERWLPVYAGNFFENENISRVWDQVVESNDKNDRLEFIVRTSPVLQQEVNKKYRELTEPLDRLETELILAIQDKYSNLKSINNTLTSYLFSATEVEENRQRYLDIIGVTDQKLNSTINELEAFTSNLTTKATIVETEVEEFEEIFQNYKNKIENLLSNF